jgi:hypothetical protein
VTKSSFNARTGRLRLYSGEPASLPTAPSDRLVPFSTGTHAHTSGPVLVALLYHGERDGSSLGHAWCVLGQRVAPRHPHPIDLRLAMEKAARRQSVFRATQTTPLPTPVGPASCVRAGKTRIVLSGGLLSTNERSGQVWVGGVEF